MASEKYGSLRMKSTGTSTPTQRANGLIALRYEEMIAAKPPIAVTVAPPRAPPTDTHPAFRNRPVSGMEDTDASKRDSGLATTTSSKAREGSVNTMDVNTVDENVSSFMGISMDFDSPPAAASASTSTPQTPTHDTRAASMVKSDSVGSGGISRWRKPGSRNGSLPKTPTEKKPATSEEDFSPLTTPIPTDSLLDEDFLEQLSFSKRGSLMLSGKKAVNGQARGNSKQR
jgi:hypothetical protein